MIVFLARQPELLNSMEYLNVAANKVYHYLTVYPPFDGHFCVISYKILSGTLLPWPTQILARFNIFKMFYHGYAVTNRVAAYEVQ